jgi:parallel beta-helix repeat protein
LRCDISRFLRGVRLRSAEGNSLLDNVLHDNGDVHQARGLWPRPRAGARNNLLRGNLITSNGDEGVHFGSGSGDNDFLDNAVFDNYREQIYLLASHGNRLIGNASYGSGSNSLYLKDSDDNHLENNAFRDRTARVTGDANGNAFVNNSFVSATLQFRVYEASPNRIPANNSVIGGTMTSGATCLRFTSSSGNVVSDVLLSGCGTQILSEGTPAHPSSNTIVGMSLTPSKVSSTSTRRSRWDGGSTPPSRARPARHLPARASGPSISLGTPCSTSSPIPMGWCRIRCSCSTFGLAP